MELLVRGSAESVATGSCLDWSSPAGLDSLMDSFFIRDPAVEAQLEIAVEIKKATNRRIETRLLSVKY